MKFKKKGQSPYCRGIIGGGIYGGGDESGSTPRILTPEIGQLCPVNLQFSVTAIVPAGVSATCQLGANPPVAMSVVGNLATGALTPSPADVGTAVTVTVTFGTTVLTVTVDVEADIIFWANSSNPNSYTASGNQLNSIKNLISGVALNSKVGSPQLFTDPRTNRPSFYFDGASWFTGTEAAVLAAASGSNLPFTTILVVSGALATASLIPYGTASTASIGNGTLFGQSAGKWFAEIFGNPSGPARVALTIPVTAGISVVVLHSANSLAIFGGANGGPETSAVVATVSPPALAPNVIGFGVQPSSTPAFPFIGLIYEVINCGVNKTALQIAAMIDRCVNYWYAQAPVVQFIGDSLTTAQLATNGGMPALLPGAVTARGGVVTPDGPLSTGQPQPIRHSANSGDSPVDMRIRVESANQGLGTIGGGTGSAGYYSRTILACVMAGTNPTGSGTDAQKAAQTAIDYAALLESIAVRLAQAGSGWRIQVTTIPPQAGVSTYPQLYNALLPAVWNNFNSLHPSNPLIIWDAYAAMGSYNPAYYVDSAHLNNAGYIKICNEPVTGMFQATVPFILANQP